MTIVTPKRFTIDDYHRLIELGFLNETDRVELIRGELIQMVAQGTPHTFSLTRLCRRLDHLPHHPYPEDVLLVVEISDSTLRYDQTTKLGLYAEAGISNYWIVNLNARQLECYSQPYQDAQNEYNYLNKQIYLPNQSVSIPEFDDALLDLSKIFSANV
jgi:Uma2 family endonuclease